MIKYKQANKTANKKEHSPALRKHKGNVPHNTEYKECFRLLLYSITKAG